MEFNSYGWQILGKTSAYHPFFVFINDNSICIVEVKMQVNSTNASLQQRKFAGTGI